MGTNVSWNATWRWWFGQRFHHPLTLATRQIRVLRNFFVSISSGFRTFKCPSSFFLLLVRAMWSVVTSSTAVTSDFSTRQLLVLCKRSQKLLPPYPVPAFFNLIVHVSRLCCPLICTRALNYRQECALIARMWTSEFPTFYGNFELWAYRRLGGCVRSFVKMIIIIFFFRVSNAESTYGTDDNTSDNWKWSVDKKKLHLVLMFHHLDKESWISWSVIDGQRL